MGDVRGRYVVGHGGRAETDQEKDASDDEEGGFPALNEWERAGEDASSVGRVDDGSD